MERYGEYDATQYTRSLHSVGNGYRTENEYSSFSSGSVPYRETGHQDAAFVYRADTYCSPSYQNSTADRARYVAPSSLRIKKQKSLRKRRVVKILLALLLVVGGWNVLHTLIGSTSAGEMLAPKSTPASEWRAGTMPYLYQTDAQWAQGEYSGGTIAENGCGPTCLSMVYIYFTGSTDYGPLAMCGFAQRNGFGQDGATLWSFMSDGAEMLGLNSKELPADATQVVSELKAGHPIICIMGPGDFTTTGHFIVLSGVADDGRIMVHDPNSEARSKQTWDVETILNQCRCLWAYSV